uniref:WASH complex subunit strumpellin n=1 Tax=Plectus sambesii TaxID=2011161 RepID=A0A914WC89_9BILA
MATSNTLDFLAANNLCGRTLLNLVSRGNAVIAELLRLADRVPSDFTNPASSRYPELLLDFTYFSQTDAFEAKLEQSQRLRDLDEELRETHIDLLIRYFLAFESVRSYVSDLNKYVEDLEDETFLQQNLESVLSVSNIEGKQLLTESLYLYGVMLMVLDQKLPGQTRERLLVAYHRFNAQRSALYSDIDEVVALLRSTGYNAREKRPVNYPENYFHRVPLKRTFVEMVVGRLRSDDLYNQIASFPLPDHRSTALAPQAAMIYVCLYFQPEILHNQTSVMREIVDKYFPDNWVISVYMGMTVNLVDAWEPYRAAKTALANSLMDSNVKHLASHHGNQIETIVKVLRQFLSEGILTKEYILDNMSKLLKSLRSCNVTLRWLMLHTSTLVSDGPLSKKCAFLRDMVVTEAKFKNALLFELILNVSQFELKLKEKLRQVLAEKDSRCQALQRNISDHLDELAQVFSGDKPLTRVQKNAKLQAWFLQLKTTVEELQFDGQSVESTGRKLVQMCSRLTEVQDLHNLDSHISVRQFLQEINDLMQQLLRTINIKDDKLAQIQTISDLTYAWDIIDQYTPYMQDGIKRDPSMAMKLRATFLKLSSALALPLLRIEQAESPDLVSVSQFYSRELVVYVRRVLQVVPETVFSLLNSIVRLQTDAIHELPTRLDKDKMKEHATLDSRYEMARLTHSISVLTEGILMMKTTLVGIIRVDPKQVLEDGVRRELVQKLSSLMHQTLAFNPKAKQSELEPKLLILAEQMEAVKRSFAYISDYISLSGYRLWQEELTRTIGYAVEQECNAYLTHKILDDDSIYQSRVIPLPKFQPIDGQSATFIGRLIRELLKETDPKTTIFASTLRTWYDAKTKQPRASPQLFKSLKAAISTVGMSGLNRLC